MTSILTNTGAMTALQTLRGINQNLSQTQNEISTGKMIASAKDNSAIWAISKVMESDVAGFKAIKSSLSLGESSIAVARNASESITGLLTDIKSKIVAAQEENVDRAKIQTDIGQLRDQITSIVNAAQFNGLNLVKGTDEVNILSSLDRAGDGTVTSSNITVDRQDMTSAAGTFGTGTSLNANATVLNTATNALNNDGNTAVITFGAATDYEAAAASFSVGGTVISFAAGDFGTATGTTQDTAAAALSSRINALQLDGITASATGAGVTITSQRAFEGVAVSVDSLTGGGATTQVTALNGTTGLTVASGTIAQRAETVTFSTSASVQDGDGYRLTFGGETFTYVASAGEGFEDIARGLQAAVGGTQLEGITTRVTQNTSGAWVLNIDNDSSTDMTLAAVGNAGGTASGGLFGLDSIDVTTDTGADAALANIETMIQAAIDASASFGSAQSRVETQSEFVSKLTDSLTAGIGTMVDADLEEASARLQALQVQQQLGIQSLSIANQAPQTILALFR
jgi:flagellin